MSDQPEQQRLCPSCGNEISAHARFCPSCGARLERTSTYDPESFEAAIADVVGDQEPQPTTWGVPPPGTPRQERHAAPPSVTGDWTATAEGWATDPPGSSTGWGAAPQASESRFQGNRTLWIILAIFGFIVFCCCGLTFVSVAIASSDGALHAQLITAGTVFFS